MQTSSKMNSYTFLTLLSIVKKEQLSNPGCLVIESKMTYRVIIMQPNWEQAVLEMLCVLKRPVPIMTQ